MKKHSSRHFYGNAPNRLTLFTLIFFVIITSTVSAQKKDEIILKIGGIPVTKEEFESNYRKNNTNILYEKDKKTPGEYLELFINFKLKVLEARKLGYDTARSFVDELKGYRDQLAKPYLTDATYNDEMVQNAYHRTQYERKASHILCRVEPNASAADTLAAWNKISGLREQIAEGADFNEIAAKYSEDPSAAQNKGLLGYFSAFQMLYPFEDAAYRTPVGQVSGITRSRFGYHLIKVHDERLTRGEIKVAHIMKMFPAQNTEETVASLKLAADTIRQKAISGADFAELAKKYSDDKQSAAEGGVLNWFTPTNMVSSFAEAAFALKNDGDISQVIRTPYGWHIVKRLELRAIPPFEKLKPELENKISRNPDISKYGDEAFDRKLRAEYQLKTDENSFRKLVASISDTLLLKQMSDDLLVSFANRNISVGSFTGFLKSQKFLSGQTIPEVQLKVMLNKFINRKLLEYENSQLEKKYPEFVNIYNEYHDGILLFNISKDKIWDVASSDTSRLQNYFIQTSKKHYWGDRFKGWIIQVPDIETRARIETLLDKKEMDKQELLDVFNSKNKANISITDVAVEKGENQAVDYFIWSGPKPADFDETTTFVHGKIVQNEMKTLEEAWGLYSSDFQEQIEKEWIDSLRKEYPVSINKKALRKIQPVE